MSDKITLIEAGTDANIGKNLSPLYCQMDGCNKFLAYTWIDAGLLLIKCNKCKTENLVFEIMESMAVPKVVAEVRCPKCNRFLYSAGLLNGIIRRKCRGCGNWVEFMVKPDLDTPEIMDNNKSRSKNPIGPSEA